LDWRNTERTLSFKIPESHWIDSIELMVSGTPEGNMGKHAPVFIKFNNSKIVPLNPGGYGFDARIKLNSGHFRTGTNQINISLPKPPGYACMSESHGAWDINLKNSFVVVKARRKIRDYQIRDLKTILKHPDFTPKSVALITKGSNALTLKALAAQAIALRTPSIPDFRINKRRADLDVIVGTRFELEGIVTDPAILKSSGPRLYMHEGRSARLVITGDTEAEVMDMMKAFGTYHLPETRRAMVGQGEFTLQNSFASDKNILGSHTELAHLGNTSFSDSWGPSEKAFKFDITDPTSTQATLTLPLLKTADISANSNVTIKLNGAPIAQPQLDVIKKTLTVDLHSQALKSVGNILTVEPSLSPITQDPCGYKELTPGLFIEDNARIEITNSRPSPVTELSRFAANGAPFSTLSGQNTQIALTARTASDMEASFKVLAHIARISGTSLVNADYARLTRDSALYSASGKNILAIGPKTHAVKPLLAGAPRSLTAALKGRNSGQRRNIQTAELARFASANERDVLTQYAARQFSGSQTQKMTKGGLIGLYAAPNSMGVLNGVISTAPGSSFSTAANNLVEIDHWNALTGSVARWNRNDVMTVQIANPVPGFDAPNLMDTRPTGHVWIAHVGRAWTSLSENASDFAFNLSNRFENAKHPSAVKTVDISPAATVKAQPATPSVHTPYIAPDRSNKTLRPKYNAPETTAIIQTATAPMPRLRGSINSTLETKVGNMRESLGNSQKRFEGMTSKTSFKREWQQTKFNIANRIAVMKRNVSASIPSQATQPFRVWMNKASAQPGLILILAFILSYILLGLASPTSRLSKHN